MSIKFVNSFSKMDYNEFCLLFPEITLSEEEYAEFQNRSFPARQTEHAAAYDLSLPYGVFISPNSRMRLVFG